MISLTQAFVDDLVRLQASDRSRVVDAFSKLLHNPRQGSLQTKKMQGCEFYEARVNQELRLIMEIHGRDMFFRSVGHHDVALEKATRIPSMPQDSISRIRTSALKLSSLESTVMSQSEASNRRGIDHLPHLTDEDLTRDFKIPPEHIQTVRAFPDGEALVNSGIQEVIGQDNAWRLLEALDVSGDIAPYLEVVLGNAIVDAIQRIEPAPRIDQFVMVIPVIRAWAGPPTFGSMIELLRARQTKVLLVTRPPDGEGARSAVRAVSRLPAATVLLNESIYTSIVSCLAPSPWSFGSIGVFAGELESADDISMVVKAGRDALIRRLADVGLHDLSTDMNSRKLSA